jgi:hypothetical protein
VRLFSLIRLLPWRDGFTRVLALLEGWVDDTANHEAKLGELVGAEYAAGQSTMPYFRVYTCPIRLALGALVLSIAAERLREPFSRLPDRLPAATVERMQRALDRLAQIPPHVFGLWPRSDPSTYLRACCESPVTSTRFEQNYFTGLEALVEQARQLGLPSGPGLLTPTAGFGHEL